VNIREIFCNTLASRAGCPYVWNARGPEAFDCCGLIEWAMAQVGRPYPRNIASAELVKFHPGPVPRGSERLGSLYLYSNPQHPEVISHVTAFFRQWKNGKKWLIGANGGGSKCVSEDKAFAAGAMVKVVLDTYRLLDLKYILDPFSKDDA
jgi:hypothetical protein